MTPTTITTYTGGTFDLLNPRVDDVRIEDIAHHLSIIGRFCGATRNLYSVAEHSVLVMRLMERDGHHSELCLAGLAHDFGEAITGDCHTVIKRMLGPLWKAIEDPIHNTIMRAFGIVWDNSIKSLVKRYDMIALRAEAHALLENRGADWNWSDDIPLILDHEIVPYLPRAAEIELLRQFGRFRPLSRRLRPVLTSV